jgi:hypothetical protein
MSKAASETRFWAKVSPEPNTGCWLWTGAAHGHGYGVFQLEGRAISAHRLAWEYANGMDFPNGSHALHSCDNPWCVNPAHLRPGSHLDNVQDRVRRGRSCKGDRHPFRLHPEMASQPGEKNGGAKLTDRDVVVIRRLANAGIGFSVLAEGFGVTREAVRLVALRRSWTHVTEE